ncbi:Aldo_ket_red domain-containing protein [Pseudozyma hubeiensis]|nr:Aldo_ket_red domain-containing protein [Pseudozyma hubeiensis]
MSHSEVSSQAMQPPSLVLVAPMPRRPIALVARRHHHHSSSSSRSRSSRTISSSSSKISSEHPAEEGKESIERITSPQRTVGHPYTRTKTPSNVSSLSNPASPANASGWSMGLGITPVSPPPRSRTGSRDDLGSRPLSRLSQRTSSMSISCGLPALPDSVAVSSHSEAKPSTDKSVPADEPMLTSPITSPIMGATSTSRDVERTPTKTNGGVRHSIHRSASNLSTRSLGQDDDQEPRSTPTIGAVSPRPQDTTQCLTLSPTSPSQQRSTASSAAVSAQLAPSLASPPERVMNDEDLKLSPGQVSLASVTPSPCLSESQSRSPTASPSPCPSPAFSRPDHLELPETRRNSSHPLPPLPSSPIPRKMTRNPFERYLSIESGTGGCTLQQRLGMAIKQRTVLGRMESELMDEDGDMDIE